MERETGGKPKLNGARTDVPKVIRYLKARKRKCQFANPGRKLGVASSIRSRPLLLLRRSNFRDITWSLEHVPSSSSIRFSPSLDRFSRVLSKIRQRQNHASTNYGFYNTRSKNILGNVIKMSDVYRAMTYFRRMLFRCISTILTATNLMIFNNFDI